MKKIAIFPDGSVGVIDTESKDKVTINGKEPTSLIDATDENLKKHFPDLKKAKSDIKV